ncbi:hypothetical protein NDU88_002504 [Pleurodeles waltl]|uniref:Uncharacterized protein n=1 Tax=Pleurodeles waltl TaxID=8319 RepID=A0AAV7KSB1_PLEWA|nr:hypothetical protein NDU88_002504 [Pleurodeles waltl]
MALRDTTFWRVEHSQGCCIPLGSTCGCSSLTAVVAAFFFLFAGISVRAGAVEVLGWLLMAPKTSRTPRMVRGKPSLEANAGRRDKKQPAAPPKDRASAQGKGVQ